ncbi:MAG: ACT domain-containing protein [Planctomycetota bacterium]
MKESYLTGRHYGLLHLIGKDRVGILQDASAFVSERGGTTEEGISHTLGTEAVVLLYVSGVPEQLKAIEKDAPKLGESLKLLALYSPIADQNKAVRHDALPMTLRVSSPDFAELLATMTDLFSRHDLPIIAHHTIKTPISGRKGLTTHRHKFTVLLPSSFNRKGFLAELDELAESMNFIRDDVTHSDYY